LEWFGAAQWIPFRLTRCATKDYAQKKIKVTLGNWRFMYFLL
jgi:hypothetical protein